MPTLKKRLVDRLEHDPKKPVTVWDDKLVGFGIKLLPSGKKQFVIKYRVGAGGRSATQRWMTLGTYGKLTCELARSQALQTLAAVARGDDPQGKKIKERKRPRLEDVWANFEQDVLPFRKPSTQRDYCAHWEKVIKPALGRRFVSEISRYDANLLHKLSVVR